MLQKGIAPADLRRADKLLALHEDFPADRRREAGCRMGGWADGRMSRRERRLDAKRPQCVRESSVNLAVGLPERAEQRDRCDDRIRNLVLVPYRLSTGWPAD